MAQLLWLRAFQTLDYSFENEISIFWHNFLQNYSQLNTGPSVWLFGQSNVEDCRISRIQITWWPFQGCHLQMTRSNGIAKIVKLKVFNTILLKKLFILPINNGITVLKIGILFWFLPFVIFRSLYMQNLYIFIEISSQCCSKNIDHEWGKSVVVAEFLILIVLNLKCEKKIIGTSNIFFLFSMYMGKKC